MSDDMQLNEAHIADYWDPDEDGAVVCRLCPHHCHIDEGETGSCGVRENRNGVLVAMGYGQVSSVALDPIEKKPLYLFHPGKRILSVGGFGCNFHCQFCQNYEISAEFKLRHQSARIMTPIDLVMLAKQATHEGNIGLAYTYNEPLTGYEFMRDTAKLARDFGLCNAIVTNGYIEKKPLEDLLPLIDAMNIDLKSFSDVFYKRIGGDLETVKNTIMLAREYCHVEVTTLVIPGENEESVEQAAEWLASMDPEIPMHISRFFPQYRYADRMPTPRETIHRLSKLAKNHLKNVFAGNM